MAPTGRKSQLVGLIAGLVLAQSAIMPAGAQEQGPTALPVYEVVKTGATGSEAEALAKQLGIPSTKLLSPSGAIEFVDPTRFLAIPQEKVESSPLVDRAIEATRNKDAKRRITPTILNAGAIKDLHVLSEEAARSKTASALSAAGLTPQFGESSVGHHELSLFSKDGLVPAEDSSGERRRLGHISKQGSAILPLCGPSVSFLASTMPRILPFMHNA